MKFYSRRVIRPTDLNPANVLFGGSLLSWIDEEAAIYAACQMKTQRIVTKLISEIDFTSSARSGDIIEFGFEVIEVGYTSVAIGCMVRNKVTQQSIIEIKKIVFVALDDVGRPTSHGAAQSRARAVARAVS